jgi:hypothetical protein
MTPVDEVSQAIVTLLGNKENRIYHLFSKHSLNMVKYMKAMTIPDVVSLNEFAEILRRDSETSKEANFVLMYISGILHHPMQSIVTLKNFETNKILSNLGFAWSELDEKYASSIKKLI